MNLTLLTRCPDRMTSTFCQAGSCDCCLMMKYWRHLCSRSMNSVPRPMESTLNELSNLFSRSSASACKCIIQLLYYYSTCSEYTLYLTSANLNQECVGLNEKLLKIYQMNNLCYTLIHYLCKQSCPLIV